MSLGMFLCKVKAHDDYVNKKRKVLVLECIGHNFFPMPHEEHFFNLVFNSISANPTKWSNILKQFVGNLPTNCLSVFDHFLKLALKGLIMK